MKFYEKYEEIICERLFNKLAGNWFILPAQKFLD